MSNMLLIVGFALIISGVISIIVLKKINFIENYQLIVPSFLMGVGLVCIIVNFAMLFATYNAETAVEIINKEYGTTFTTNQYLYQSELIKIIINQNYRR